ncbi:protein of unknown function [Candidatus Nitrosocosmicus franklandus]|uniref:Uncharacterized protein n=1 Tax=Candidatus Nitrosocosmicus franklandianus TaxID=1798806 RepID=A0A484IFD4_9ARCH|nr:protein of unknown function [Candidatus Nitrosocosmicus franklandus]
MDLTSDVTRFVLQKVEIDENYGFGNNIKTRHQHSERFIRREMDLCFEISFSL